MPWKVRGKCVYKKNTGKKVGCTKGSVKKYLAALHINAHEGKTFNEHCSAIINENLPFMGYAPNTPDMNGDQTGVGEGEYADNTGDEISLFSDEADKDQIIQDTISNLEELKTSHDWNTPVNADILQGMVDDLKSVGIEPTDIEASIKEPNKQKQYLITGPSSWKGGNGALNDLKAILAGHEPEPIDEEESLPASSLPMGSSSADTAASTGDNINESFYEIGQVCFDNPYNDGQMKYFPGTEGQPVEGKSSKDALNKFIRRLAIKHKIPTDPRILYTNALKHDVHITKVEAASKPQPTYWWQDKD